jgi:hypothetical protein
MTVLRTDRGLATNLHRLGVQDKLIQAILRQSNVSVTQACYIKTVDFDAVIAMQKLEHATNMQLEATDRKSAVGCRSIRFFYVVFLMT